MSAFTAGRNRRARLRRRAARRRAAATAAARRAVHAVAPRRAPRHAAARPPAARAPAHHFSFARSGMVTADDVLLGFLGAPTFVVLPVIAALILALYYVQQTVLGPLGLIEGARGY